MEKIWPYDFIGSTPYAVVDDVVLKMEGYNPTGSIKDRVAWAMMEDAERSGILKPGMRIVEATSGNLGISMAMLSSVRGYSFTAIMPENMGAERISMMRSYGAEVILTPASGGSLGAFRHMKSLMSLDEGDTWFPQQARNPMNVEAHRKGTGAEIVRDVPETDTFVAAVGTGGTITGTALAFRDASADIHVVGVEPEESAVLSGKAPGNHGIPGIGRGEVPFFISENPGLMDEIVTVSSAEAVDGMRYLWREKGISCGPSGGANFVAARRLARSGKGRKVLTILPDRGDRYLSMLH